MNKSPKINMLGETERYAVWVSKEPDTGENIYHIELENITVHFFPDEWDEFADMIMQALR
jgi:hypothetical protein